jgi:hypothetical protein
MVPMKAITLRHPWPFAIINLGKRIENRTWAPSLRIGEKFAIHGGKFPVQPDGICKGAANQEYWDDIHETLRSLAQGGLIDGAMKVTIRMLQETVGICAVATYGGTVRESDSPWFCGPVGWVITDVLALPAAVPCRGAQGLWDVPADALEKMRAQFARPAR